MSLLHCSILDFQIQSPQQGENCHWQKTHQQLVLSIDSQDAFLEIKRVEIAEFFKFYNELLILHGS